MNAPMIMKSAQYAFWFVFGDTFSSSFLYYCSSVLLLLLVCLSITSLFESFILFLQEVEETKQKCTYDVIQTWDCSSNYQSQLAVNVSTTQYTQSGLAFIFWFLNSEWSKNHEKLDTCILG